MIKDTEYIGNELELFEQARRWKKYWGSIVAPYIRGIVGEVGAGLGGTTLQLSNNTQIKKWICIEPDQVLLNNIASKINAKMLPDTVSLFNGFLNDYPAETQFDSLLYIDVIEHIKDDRQEVTNAISRLSTGGHLMILVPAHQFLFSEFDHAIGHFRRYNKEMILKLLPDRGVKILRHQYLDAVGLCASLANKLFLKQSNPTIQQIRFWDDYIVPLSKIVDPLTFNMLGKSLLIIVQKQ